MKLAIAFLIVLGSCTSQLAQVQTRGVPDANLAAGTCALEREIAQTPARDKHGLSVYFWSNGGYSQKMKARGNLANGKKNGMWELFYSNGIRSSTGSYFDNKKMGTWTFWREDGTLDWIGEFKEGYLDGPCVQFDTSRRIRARAVFSKGQRVTEWTDD